MKRLIIVMALFMPIFAFSSIQMDTTRVIFNEKENEQTLKVSNKGNKQALVQIWLSENGDKDNSKVKDTGFIITQPVFKLKAGKDKIVRIIGNESISEMYPSDRESLLWLNFLDIPPQVENKNAISIAIHTKMKFFYIPADIDITREGATNQLTWFIEKGNGGTYIIAKNASPLYINIGSIEFPGKNIIVEMDDTAIPPFNELKFKLITSAAIGHNEKIQYAYISDLGGYVYKDSITQ